jgi:hypothetical protein
VNRPTIASYKRFAATNFAPCADYIAIGAQDAVCNVLQRLTEAQVKGLGPSESEALINFRFSKADRRKIEQLVVDDFLRKHMGFEQLFLRAYRSCARMALNRSICPYSKSDSIPPIDFYESRYLPLFQALALSYTSLIFVDGNLANNMPPSPVRSKLVRSGRAGMPSREA